MATTIVTKYGSDAPATTDIVRGELAVDTENGRLYTENAAGAVVEIGLKPEANVDVTGTITATGTSVFASLDISGDIDVDGTTNLDVVDIDGAVDFASTTAHAGNATFADNAKAIFGAGSDLEIYHDGSHSYISDSGTGYLRILASDYLQLMSSSSEVYFNAAANGGVTLYHDNSGKISTTATGIDVTGTATMDGLTVDGDAVFTTGDTIRLNTSDGSDNGVLAVSGGGANSDARGAKVRFYGNEHASLGGALDLAAGNVTSGHIYNYTNAKLRQRIDYNGDISFFEDTGTTAKLFWDASAESLGIGTSSPSAPLHVIGNDGVQFNRSGQTNGFIIRPNASADGIRFTQGGTGDRMTIDASGNVGIGGNGTGNGLGVYLSKGTGANFFEASDGTKTMITGSDSTQDFVKIGSFSAHPVGFVVGNAEKMRIDASGQVKIHTPITNDFFGLSLQYNNSDTADFKVNQTTGQIKIGGSATGYYPAFFSNNAERMRIDASGNLLVGTTQADPAGTSTNVVGTAIGAAGYLSMSRDAATVAFFNRKTSDGTIADFRKDGTAVGSIGAKTSSLTIGSGDVGLYFDSANNRIIPFNTTTQVNNDAVFDVGAAAYRYKDLYLSGNANVGGNINNFVATNSGNPEFSIGSSATNRLLIQGVYNSGAQLLNYVTFRTSTTASHANAGKITFGVDDVDILEINDSGIAVTGEINLGTFSSTGGTTGTEFISGEIHSSYNGTAPRKQVYIYNPNGEVGSIQSSFTSCNFNTTSDYRLKENVVYDWDATTRLKQLKPARFNFISYADRTVDGFLAHEVSSVVPEAVSGTKDAMKDEEYEVTPAVEEVRDEEGNITTEAVEAVMGTRSVPDMQGIDQSKLVPLLVKAIQELEARIAALES